MDYQWNYQPLKSEEEAQVERLAVEADICPTTARLLVQRGITTPEATQKFFRPALPDLHDPFLMTDMDKAVERLNKALGRKERILVYGDYDVDGCTAVALVYKFLQQYSSNLEYYIPDRYEEGYGVSIQAIDYAARTGVKLVIILDCGIKAVEAISYAKSLGIDFIICDHHVPGDVMPPAVAILNAKRRDATYPYPHLCGCGVGFKFMQAFALSNGIHFSSLVPLLDLCAVSIAADIVPIMDENRIMAFHGLRQLNINPSTGLKAIIEVCGLSGKELTMNDIIFRIGPRINASGRIQNGREAVQLLVEKDLDKAREMAKMIDQYNEMRKDLDHSMTDQAIELVRGRGMEEGDDKPIVIFNEEWHKGLIGIVASRLTENFHRPTVVLTRVGGMATGSARSVPGFDIYKALDSCRDLLDNFGGHTYAAGLTLKAEYVEAFTSRFTHYVTTHIKSEQTLAKLDIHAEISFADITPQFYGELKRFNPLGPDNAKPIFLTRGVYDYGTSKVVGREQEHIKLELIDGHSPHVINGIAFGQSQKARVIKSRHAFDICYSIEENTHRRGEFQLQIEDIRPGE